MELYARFQDVAVNRIKCDEHLRGVVDTVDGLFSTVIADVTTTAADGKITRELFAISAHQVVPKNLDLAHALHNKLKLEYGIDDDDCRNGFRGSVTGRERKPYIQINDRPYTGLVQKNIYLTYNEEGIESIRIDLPNNVIYIGAPIKAEPFVPPRGIFNNHKPGEEVTKILCNVGNSDKELQIAFGTNAQFEIVGERVATVLHELARVINDKLEPTGLEVRNLHIVS